MNKILDELEAAEANATSAPWRAGFTYHYTKDAELIALSRNHIKALLECARALEWYEKASVGEFESDCGDKATIALARLDQDPAFRLIKKCLNIIKESSDGSKKLEGIDG